MEINKILNRFLFSRDNDLLAVHSKRQAVKQIVFLFFPAHIYFNNNFFFASKFVKTVLLNLQKIP